MDRQMDCLFSVDKMILKRLWLGFGRHTRTQFGSFLKVKFIIGHVRKTLLMWLVLPLMRAS